jgi:DNA-directed RNA polymerase subunit RPC12/RpoP
MTRPDDVNFRCPECGRRIRFRIGIREGVPSVQAGALDYFPRCPHCSAGVRITVFDRPVTRVRFGRLGVVLGAGVLTALALVARLRR